MFIDFTKALDSEGRNGSCLWNTVSRVTSFITMTMAAQWYDGDKSRIFSVENGVKQGWVMATTLFSIYLTGMLQWTFKDCHLGVAIRTCMPTNTNLFKESQFKSKRHTKNSHTRAGAYWFKCYVTHWGWEFIDQCTLALWGSGGGMSNFQKKTLRNTWMAPNIYNIQKVVDIFSHTSVMRSSDKSEQDEGRNSMNGGLAISTLL